LVYALWQFTKSMWAHRNAIVHGINSEEAATCFLTGLRDQVHQHYLSFSVDAGYVLFAISIYLPLEIWNSGYPCHMIM